MKHGRKEEIKDPFVRRFDRYEALRDYAEDVEDVEILVGVPRRGALLGLSLGAPRALLGSLVKKEGRSCPQKDFREYDSVRSLGGPLEAYRWGPFGAN